MSDVTRPVPRRARVLGPVEDPRRYRLDRRVASDRESTAWHGWRRAEELEVEVAVRITHPETAAYLHDDGLLRRWRWEAELASSIGHPVLEPVRELFLAPSPDGGRHPVLCRVTNWFDGQRLDHWVAGRSRADRAAALSLLVQLSDAVDHLHRGVGARPIVHRTLGPRTVLVDPSGALRLEGLGSARPAAPELEAVPETPTPWLPPEVIRGEGYRPAGDRWCVGALAFLVLTGCPPPAFDPELAARLLSDAPLVAGDERVIGHVLRLLHPDPSERPPHLLAWVTRLGMLLEEPRPVVAVSDGAPTPGGAAPAPSVPLPATEEPPGGDAPSDVIGASSPSLSTIRHRQRVGLGVAVAVAGAAIVAVGAQGRGSSDLAEAQPETTLLTFPAGPAAAATGSTGVVTTSPPPDAAAATTTSLPTSLPAPGPAGGAADGGQARVDDFARTTVWGGELSWSIGTGDWAVRDGAATPVAVPAEGVALLTADPGAGSVSFRVTARDLIAGSGLVFRIDGPDRYWALTRLDAPGHPEVAFHLLQVTAAGIRTVGGFAGPRSGSVELGVDLVGDEIVVVIDGDTVGAVTEPDGAGTTRLGLGSVAGGIDVTRFDEVRIVPLAG